MRLFSSVGVTPLPNQPPLKQVLWVFGGINAAADTAFKTTHYFDSQEEKWLMGPNMLSTRYGFRSINHAGAVYHVGGTGDQKIERWTKSKPDEYKFKIEESKTI